MPRIALLAIVLTAYGAPKSHNGEYRSPDKAFTAVLSAAGNEQNVESEDRIELKDRSGKVVLEHSFVAGEGEPGYTIVKAQWTTDSNFFVLAIEKSGTDPEHKTPILFWARKHPEGLCDLGDYFNDSPVFANFRLDPPSFITLQMLNQDQPQRIDLGRIHDCSSSEVR